MFRLETYMDELVKRLREIFRDRLLYVGLQGSYMRNEATENSDIDVMVILDELTVDALDSYKAIIEALENSEKSCGFICGKNEIDNWNPLELCHLVHSTKDYYGTLADLIPQYSENDIINFIKVSLGNLYHEICHRYVHSDIEKNRKKLPSTYKSVFFILQNIYFLRMGVFIQTKNEMLLISKGIDKEVLEMSLFIKENDYNFSQAFELLLLWCKNTLSNL